VKALVRQVMKKRKMIPRQPGEVLTMCDGYRPVRDINKLLKAYGLVVKMRSDRQNLGDQVYLRIEQVKANLTRQLFVGPSNMAREG
jgi:hypothetical protein